MIPVGAVYWVMYRLGVLALVTACAAPEWPRGVEAQAGSPPELHAALAQATAAWNQVALEELGHRVLEPRDGDVVVYPWRRPSCPRACAELDAAGDWGWLTADEIWVDPVEHSANLAWVLTHELGHVLGLEDRVDAPGVMRGDEPLSERDRYELRAAAAEHKTAQWPW